MKKLAIISLSLIIIAIFFSCKKNQLGGNRVITGVVAHHSKVIANSTVFIKFNASEFPGSDTTLYDAKVKADGNGNYTIKCYKGNYYLYGYGYDYDILYPYIVVGGLPVHVGSKKTVQVDIAVTED